MAKDIFNKANNIIDNMTKEDFKKSLSKIGVNVADEGRQFPDFNYVTKRYNVEKWDTDPCITEETINGCDICHILHNTPPETNGYKIEYGNGEWFKFCKSCVDDKGIFGCEFIVRDREERNQYR